MLKSAAMVFGVVLLAIGILGFVPGVTTADGMLLGTFRVNGLHNVIHLLSGIVALIAGMSGEKAARTYFQVFGVVYAIVAILGFMAGDRDLLGIVSNNMAETLLHTVIAVVSLYLGFGGRKSAMPATA